MGINIGGKLRSLRQKNNLTQKELADRCELSKGFISQLESNQTSPSLSTLEDILTTLGSSFHEFFSDEQGDDPVCRKEDVFIKEDDGVTIHWLIPNAQKKDIEPILVTIQPGAETETDLPHMGEEFGYVLSGAVTLELGGKSYRVRKGDSVLLVHSTHARPVGTQVKLTVAPEDIQVMRKSDYSPDILKRHAARV